MILLYTTIFLHQYVWCIHTSLPVVSHNFYVHQPLKVPLYDLSALAGTLVCPLNLFRLPVRPVYMLAVLKYLYSQSEVYVMCVSDNPNNSFIWIFSKIYLSVNTMYHI